MNVRQIPPLVNSQDPKTAWINGYIQAMKIGEDIINDMIPYMDATSKAFIIKRHQQFIETKVVANADGLTIKPTRLKCGHAARFIEKTFEGKDYFCTHCGMRGR